MNRQLTSLIYKEGEWFVALCPELDVASQGETQSEARENLREAVELFLDCASAEEIQQRLASSVEVESLDVKWGG
jgi:predicted RNase H-like HicB family nuclease